MGLSVWIVFNVFILILLAVDLGVFHRRTHEVHFREAIVWTLIWMVLALLFNLGLYMYAGPQKALEFLTGYFIEKSLSIDNIFVFLALFASFGIAPQYHHKVLFWGILGALICRSLFIAAGIALIRKFHWILYLFGAGLLFTGAKMAFQKPAGGLSSGTHRILTIVRKVLPISEDRDSGRFFVRSNGRWMATPLFLVLLLIEITDVIFASDSIPAILAISVDPFIVYTSNVFAILGLRALYFALAGLLPKFHYLHYGLSVIIVMVGLKMILSDTVRIPLPFTLIAIVLVLGGSILASLMRQGKPLCIPMS